MTPALSALLADPAVGWVITDVPDVALRLVGWIWGRGGV